MALTHVSGGTVVLMGVRRELASHPRREESIDGEHSGTVLL